MTELFVRDDLGELWTFDGSRLMCVGDDSEGGGYPCSDWAQAVWLLSELGFVSDEPKQSPWISVEDQLPEDGKPVLCKISGQTHSNAVLYRSGGDWWMSLYGLYNLEVAHWQSLPKDPK